MKLSEAIREGAKLGPQIKKQWRLGSGYCALGGAYQLQGCLVPDGLGTYLVNRDIMPLEWIRFSEEQRECPVCCDTLTTLGVIAHLNDFHDWTREHIADYVAQFETPSQANREQQFLLACRETAGQPLELEPVE